MKGSVYINDNIPLPNQEITVISVKSGQVIKSILSDKSGHFDIDVNNDSDLDLLFKIRYNNYISIYHKRININKDLNDLNLVIDTLEYHTVNVQINTTNEGDISNDFYIFIDPIELVDVSNELSPNYKKQTSKIGYSYFFREAYNQFPIEFKLRKGVYSIGGDNIIDDNPMSGKKQFIVDKITKQNVTLDGNCFSGFKFKVDKDLSLELYTSEYHE